MSNKSLAEGALFTALVVLFSLMEYVLPIASIVTLFIIPIPIVILTVRHGLTSGVMGTIAASIIIGLLTGPISGLYTLVNLVFLGLWFGNAIRKQEKPWIIMVVGAILVALSAVVNLFITVKIGGIPIAELVAEYKEMFNSVMAAYEEAGLFEQLAGGIDAETFKEMIYTTIVTLLPVGFVIWTGGTAGITFLLSNYILKRLGNTCVSFKPFRYWRLPWGYLWGLIVALLAVIGYHYLEIDILYKIGINLIYLYIPILSIFGFSLMVYWWKHWLTTFWRVLLVICLVISPLSTLLFLSLAAIIDSFANVRGKIERQMDDMGLEYGVDGKIRPKNVIRINVDLEDKKEDSNNENTIRNYSENSSEKSSEEDKKEDK